MKQKEEIFSKHGKSIKPVQKIFLKI